VEYAKVREQFGRTIGTFQAVKHHAAKTTVATWDAARSDDLDSAWFEGAVAASHAIRTQIFNAQCNIQLHGGIGFTWEHDAHLYLRRPRTLAAVLPDGAEEHRTAAREAVPTWRSLPAEERRDFLVDSGYRVPHWPRPWGSAAGGPRAARDRGGVRGGGQERSGRGTYRGGPADMGNDDQRERWVEPVLRGQVIWCQLFSEPDKRWPST
jgi:alkylation response protein AidB-like acyl-CoA dehydrogenase